MKRWTSWPHIGPLSGEWTVGRLAVDVYTRQAMKQRPRVVRLTGDGFRAYPTYAVLVPGLHVFVRRWKP